VPDQSEATKSKSIFISYAEEDKKTADYLRSALTRAGYQVSTPIEDISPGDRWISNIYASLDAADVVVILISKASESSSWTLLETSAAIAGAERSARKRLIPVVLDKRVHPSGLLASYQWIITSGDPREVADKVLQAIEESPDVVDKARDRQVARESLVLAQETLDRAEDYRKFRVEGWDRSLRLVLVMSLVLVVVSLFIVLGVTRSASTAALASAIGAVLGVFTAAVGYYFGKRNRNA